MPDAGHILNSGPSQTIGGASAPVHQLSLVPGLFAQPKKRIRKKCGPYKPHIYEIAARYGKDAKWVANQRVNGAPTDSVWAFVAWKTAWDADHSPEARAKRTAAKRAEKAAARQAALEAARARRAEEAAEASPVKCANSACGNLFNPLSVRRVGALQRIYRRKFCCEACKSKASNARQYAKEQLKMGRANIPETGVNAEIVDLYINKKLGFKSISRLLNIGHSSVRRVLICSGVWSPDPKFNGHAKKGTGKYSRANKPAPIDIETRRRERAKLARKDAATCLRYMYRNHKRLQTACRELKLSQARVYGVLRGRKSYEKLTIKTGFWSNEYRRTGHRSNIFKDEAEFQRHIASMLDAAGVHYTINYDVEGSRADFKIARTHIVEAKVQTNCKAAYALAGQLLHAKTCEPSSKLLALIPSDCMLKPSLADTIRATGAFICTERNILSVFTSQAAV